MVARRVHGYEETLDLGVRLLVRWEAERDVVQFAVLLLVEADGTWHPVVLFDCSHADRNDRHRYSLEGVKGDPEVFHRGTPGEAMRDAIDLIATTHERMIERWRR